MKDYYGHAASIAQRKVPDNSIMYFVGGSHEHVSSSTAWYATIMVFTPGDGHKLTLGLTM